MTFDQERITELEKLWRVVRLAGSLNRGSSIVEKIKELETLCGELSRMDYAQPRASFLMWIDRAVCEAREQSERREG